MKIQPYLKLDLYAYDFYYKDKYGWNWLYDKDTDTFISLFSAENINVYRLYKNVKIVGPSLRINKKYTNIV